MRNVKKYSLNLAEYNTIFDACTLAEKIIKLNNCYSDFRIVLLSFMDMFIEQTDISTFGKPIQEQEKHCGSCMCLNCYSNSVLNDTSVCYNCETCSCYGNFVIVDDGCTGFAANNRDV